MPKWSTAVSAALLAGRGGRSAADCQSEARAALDAGDAAKAIRVPEDGLS
jgi:hypothetical protein